LQTTDAELRDLTTRFKDLEEQRREEAERFAQLKAQLETELQENNVRIEQLENQVMVINVSSEILFNTGSTRIKRSGAKALNAIASVLNTYPEKRISVEGHCDAIPVGDSSRYPSNWELSAARAAAAVRYLQDQAGVDPDRMMVVGHGKHRPVGNNDTEEGRAANRRLEIMLTAPTQNRTVTRLRTETPSVMAIPMQ
jgi:chemotaxis protein MotB